MDNTQVSLSETRRPMEQLFKNLAGKNGREWFNALKKFLRKENPWGAAVKAVSQFLRPSAIEGEVILDACDGNETIADSKKVFSAGIDGDFKNYGANATGPATEQAEVEIFDLIKDGTFAQMFCSLGADLNSLCLTHKQIINFCKRFPQHLSKTGLTFFLFKVGDQFFVAVVLVFGGGALIVSVNRFEDDNVYDAEDGDRVVVPQLGL